MRFVRCWVCTSVTPVFAWAYIQGLAEAPIINMSKVMSISIYELLMFRMAALAST